MQIPSMSAVVVLGQRTKVECLVLPGASEAELSKSAAKSLREATLTAFGFVGWTVEGVVELELVATRRQLLTESGGHRPPAQQGSMSLERDAGAASAYPNVSGRRGRSRTMVGR